MKVTDLPWKIVAKVCASIALREVGAYVRRLAIDKIHTEKIRKKIGDKLK